MKQYSYTINGQSYDVEFVDVYGQTAKVKVNGLEFEVEFQGRFSEDDLPEVSGEAPAAPKAATPAAQPVPVETKAAGEGTPVTAPLPGVVTKVLVAVGQKVKKGDTVAVLEAMKMENNIQAESDGTVTGVCCSAGDSVMEGDALVTIL